MNLLDGVATIRDVVAVAPPPASTAPPTVFERIGSRRARRQRHLAHDPRPGFRLGPRRLLRARRDQAGSRSRKSGRHRQGRAAFPLAADARRDRQGAFRARRRNPHDHDALLRSVGRHERPRDPRRRASGRPRAARSRARLHRPRPARSRTSRSTPASHRAGQVNGYNWGSGNAEIGARSLTIVRLDTGEIIRTFRQANTEVNATLQIPRHPRRNRLADHRPGRCRSRAKPAPSPTASSWAIGTAVSGR